MLALLLAAGLVVAITSVAIWLFNYNKVRPLLAAFVLPGLVVLHWLLKLVYINSQWCDDETVCDNGGMLATSASSLVLLITVALASSLTVGLYKAYDVG